MNHVHVNWDFTLIGLSYLISVFGSYTALRLAIKIPTASAELLPRWLFMSALALGGCGIWSMHFIGMLAYQVNIPLSYDPFLTAASMIFGVAAVAVGLYMVGKGNGSLGRLVLAGFFTGSGVAAMHYTGMLAMQMKGTIHWNYTLVGLSLVIAVVASCVALWLAFNLRGFGQRVGSAFVMGVAVCGMHYTGMAAMSMDSSSSNTAHIAGTSGGLSSMQMGITIFVISAAILAMGLMSTNKVESEELVFEV